MKFQDFLNESPRLYDVDYRPSTATERSITNITATFGDAVDHFNGYGVHKKSGYLSLSKDGIHLVLVAIAKLPNGLSAIGNIIKSKKTGSNFALNVYDYLIHKDGYVISDIDQTMGGIKTWKKLYAKYKDNFGYFDGKEFIKINSESEISDLYDSDLRLMIKK